MFLVYSCLQLSIPSTAPVYTEALLHRCQVLGENGTTGSDWSATNDICCNFLTFLESESWSDGPMEQWSEGELEQWNDGAMKGESWSNGRLVFFLLRTNCYVRR